MHKVTSFFTILLLLAVSLEASDRIVINSGHTKPVRAFASDYEHNILFSGDENGTVKIWDLLKNHLIMNLQVSHLPIKKIAVNPVNSNIAILETDSLSTFKLSVWDWKTRTKLFTHRLSELPLFLMFSPKGSFIVYGKPDWNSLTFIDAKKGFRISMLSDDTGIVSSAFVSSSEKTILLYNPSGTIQYWDLKSGKQKVRPIRTKGNLSSINITQNGKYMTGYYDGKIYLVDLVSGRVMDTVPLTNVRYSSMDKKTGKIALVTVNSDRYDIIVYSIIDKPAFLRTASIKLNTFPDESGISFNNNTVYFSTSDGSLYYSSIRTGITSLFSRNILCNISDIGIVNGSMLIATEKKLIVINSDLFENIKDRSAFTRFTVTPYLNSFNSTTGIVSSGKNAFFIYSKGTDRLLKKFTPAGTEEILTDNFTSPIVMVKYVDNNFLSLESKGRCSIIEETTGETVFSYTSYGIQSVTRIHSGNIIAGRNQTSLMKSPLLNINPETEEVVPIKDSNILTFMVDYDSTTRTLYSLGFERKDNALKTVLKSHRGRTLEITETLLTYPGEDAEASFIVDKNRSRVFTSLGFGGIHMLSWNGFTSLESSGHIPRKLQLYKDILFSVNSDSSISLWDTSKGSFLMDIYLLDNGGWAAIRKDGSVFSSPSAKHYIITVKD